jgi:hypothetical protein
MIIKGIAWADARQTLWVTDSYNYLYAYNGFSKNGLYLSYNARYVCPNTQKVAVDFKGQLWRIDNNGLVWVGGESHPGTYIFNWQSIPSSEIAVDIAAQQGGNNYNNSLKDNIWIINKKGFVLRLDGYSWKFMELEAYSHGISTWYSDETNFQGAMYITKRNNICYLASNIAWQGNYLIDYFMLDVDGGINSNVNLVLSNNSVYATSIDTQTLIQYFYKWPQVSTYNGDNITVTGRYLWKWGGPYFFVSNNNYIMACVSI